MVETVLVSISRTPPFDDFSFLNNSKTSFHNFFVLSVAFAKKEASPS